MAYASVAAETWLYNRVIPLPEVAAAFGTRFFADEGGAKDTEAGRFMTFARHPVPPEAGGIGRQLPPTAWAFTYDITGWTEGKDTDPIVPAMNAVDAVLRHGDSGIQDGYLVVVVNEGGELPPAPPARPGEPVASRLGRTITLFLSRA
jgi:hypothetical protein